MSAKRFIAPDMRRALQLVREQLGDDAVIIHNQRVPEGVELIATTAMRVTSHAATPMEKPMEKPRALAQTTPWRTDELKKTPSVSVDSDPQRPVAKTLRSRVRKLGRLDALVGKGKVANGAKMRSENQAFSEVFSGVNQNVEQDTAPEKSSALPQLQHQRASDRYELVAPNPKKRLSHKSTAQKSLADATSHAITPHAVTPHTGTPQTATHDSRGFVTDVVSSEQHSNLLISTLREEVHLLRALLQSQSTDMRREHFACTQPLRTYLLQQLLGAGFLPPLARDWVENVHTAQSLKAAWKQLLQEMLKGVLIDSHALFDDYSALALVGPTGSGKTSTIGKLAAQYVMKHGADALAIITTDAYRLGAHDQLRTLTRILGVPLTIVDDHVSLKRALDTYAHRRKVLIDTAGLNQQDPAWQLQFAELASCQQRVKHYLVVSTTNQFAVHVKALADYCSLSVSGCILTKLDESGRLGDSLSAVIRAALPIAFVTTGIRMPDDLARAEALPLIKQALASVGEVNVDPVSLAACFGMARQEGTACQGAASSGLFSDNTGEEALSAAPVV